MSPRIVLFGYGNPSRGDDALGPALVACARLWLAEHPDASVALFEDFQLQVEHALDLADADLALFVDADASTPAPFGLRRVQAARDSSYTTHELSPEAVLYVAREVTGRDPPPAWVLGVRGEQFELGDPLSDAAERHLELAWAALQEMLEAPDVAVWDQRAHDTA
ncbi:MAG: hydrogenase maturation protease [Gemmatimonadota bacterium]|nr:hydrogenase maturation protease [Gemmatimonadota bacterium]